MTREKLINYINHNLECWCEAFFKLLIKILLLTIYLTIMVVIFNKEYICEEEEEKSNNNNHWNCKQYQKCKVKRRIFNGINILKLNYYFIFYILFYIYQFLLIFSCNYIINKIRKCQQYKFVIFGYKICEYFLLISIAIFDFYDDKKCYNSEDNDNEFMKIKELKLNLINLIVDIFINSFQ